MEAKRRGNDGVGEAMDTQMASTTISTSLNGAPSSISALCNLATKRGENGHLSWDKGHQFTNIIANLKKNGENCGVVQSLTNAQPNTPSSAALTAAQRSRTPTSGTSSPQSPTRAEQQTISSDKQKPVINIAGTAMNGPQGTIKGYARDNTGIAEVMLGNWLK